MLLILYASMQYTKEASKLPLHKVNTSTKRRHINVKSQFVKIIRMTVRLLFVTPKVIVNGFNVLTGLIKNLKNIQK